MTYAIFTLTKYDEWYMTQTGKSKLQIEKRLAKIKEEGHFGHIRDLGDDLIELKFNDGRRIYYTIIPINNMILLLGGGKNGQDSDILKAKNSIAKAKENAKKRSDLKS